VLAPVGVISFYSINRSWTSWRDLWVMWGAWFLGIVILSAIRDALPWGLIPATATGLFFALGLRQLPRRIPKLREERIKSVPPLHHIAIEIGQLVFAGAGAIFIGVIPSLLPIGIFLIFLACALVGLETLSRLRSRRWWDLGQRIEQLENPGDTQE